MSEIGGFHSRTECESGPIRAPERLLWMVVISGGVIMGLALGVRHVQGLFLLPISVDRGWSRELFAIALATQNLVWGIAQPFAGMLADRYGARRVIAIAVALYAIGAFGMTLASSPALFILSSGVIIGLALSGTAFGVIYAAISRIVTPGQRAWATGMAGAIGGFGQLALVPTAQYLIADSGWQSALISLAILLAMALPLAWHLRDRSSPMQSDDTQSAAQSLRSALREAAAHRGFWLLNFGFLACGFQLAFIAAHLPAYLIDRGLGAEVGVGALATIALTNIIGTYVCGWLGGKLRQKHILAVIYLARAMAIALFVGLPLSPATVYAFAAVMGFLWLGTVPLTHAVITRVFGVQYLATLFGFVFVGHQLGSFLGVWLGGRVFAATGSYDALWLGAIVLGILAAALHWPIDDRRILRTAAVGFA